MGFQAVLTLLETVACGRLCLSVLPPGWPGNHDRREGGATLCASWLLGGAALALAPWLWLWGAALLLRLALLPAGLRPRHERDSSARPLWFVLFALCAASAWAPSVWEKGTLLACAAGFLWTGWNTWKRRADRRARALAWLGFVAAGLSLWCAR